MSWAHLCDRPSEHVLRTPGLGEWGGGVRWLRTHHTGLQQLKGSSMKTHMAPSLAALGESEKASTSGSLFSLIIPLCHSREPGLTAQTSLNRNSLGKHTFFPMPFAFLISSPQIPASPLSWQHYIPPPLPPDVSRSQTFCDVLEIFPAPPPWVVNQISSHLCLYQLNRGKVQTQEAKITQNGEEGALGNSPWPKWNLAFCFSVAVSKYIYFKLHTVHTDRFNLFIMALLGFSRGLKSPSQALLACVSLL